jgi:putative Ca2+/H+ antiporter (TMEM165/GDT1 family)
MEPKTILSAFAVVFLAELGDKTQLAILGMAADSKALISVFLGSVTAMILATLLAVVVGGMLAASVPARAIQVLAGSMFVLIGALMLWGKL